MKNYRKSDYAKNIKNKAAIVYSHNGCTEILTFERISESDPTITREEFEKFKKLSDEMFHEIFKGDDMESKYSVAQFNDEIVDDISEADSAEDEFLSMENEKEKATDNRFELAMSSLTEKQRRRVTLYSIGLSTYDIAKKEGCNQNAVWKSIKDAKKKFEKYFPEMGG